MAAERGLCHGLRGIGAIAVRSRLAVATLVVLAAGLGGRHAQAQVFSNTSVPPLVVEAGGGWNGPMGVGGIAVVLDPGGRFSGGVGLGVFSSYQGSPPIGAFGRARLWRRGDFALGLSATLSRMDYSASRNYTRSPANVYAPDYLSWSWEPGYLAAGALTAEVGGAIWSFRVEAGLGYILNDPSCSYRGGATSYAGDCKSAEIPDAYHFAVEPGRVIPSLTASLGLRLGGPVAVDESYRSPSTARLLALSATLVPLGIGALLWSSNEDNAAIAVGAAGLSLGPSTGHLYAGAYGHAVGLTAARSTAGLLGWAVFLVSTIRSSDCQRSACDVSSSGVALATGLLLAVPVLAVYDIIDAPRAARAANAQHGITSLALVPSIGQPGPTKSHALNVAGRF